LSSAPNANADAMLLAVALRVAALSAVEGPCDIYAKGGTPCVAAHSMTRALYGAYDGPLYSLVHKEGPFSTPAGNWTYGAVGAHPQIQYEITALPSPPRTFAVVAQGQAHGWQNATMTYKPNAGCAPGLNCPNIFVKYWSGVMDNGTATGFASVKWADHSYWRRKPAAVAHVGVKSAGGVADSAAHDAFCSGKQCVVERIWDQSEVQNHLGIEAGAWWLGPPRDAQDLGVNFTDPASKTTLGGSPVYSALFVGEKGGNGKPFVGQGYSNRTARQTATGDEPQSMYAIFGGKHFNDGCCFDYGNAEKTKSMFDGSMEAIYFGNGYAPGDPTGKSGHGPWLMVDLENGIYARGPAHHVVPSITTGEFIVGFVKGDSGNHYAVKHGDAQKAGSLTTVWDGPRPKGYEVMKKQGAIILGSGGDNSPWGAGTWYEGCMTKGYASNVTEAAVMANIVAAGYGK